MYRLLKSVLITGISLAGGFSLNAQENQSIADDQVCTGLSALVTAAQGNFSALKGVEIAQSYNNMPIHTSRFLLPGFQQARIDYITSDLWTRYQAITIYGQSQHDVAIAHMNRLLTDIKRCGYGSGEPGTFVSPDWRTFKWYTALSQDADGKNYRTTLTLNIEKKPEGYPLSLEIVKHANDPYRYATVDLQNGQPDVVVAPFVQAAIPEPEDQSSGVETTAVTDFKRMWAEADLQLDELENYAEQMREPVTEFAWWEARRQSLNIIDKVRSKLKAYKDTYFAQMDSSALNEVNNFLSMLDEKEKELKMLQYQE